VVKRWVLGAVAGAGVLAVAGGLFTSSGAGGSPSTQPTQSSQSVAAGGSAAPAAAVDTLTKTILLAQQMLVSRPQDYATWAALGLGYVQQAKATVDPSYYGKAEGAVARSLALNSTGNFSGCELPLKSWRLLHGGRAVLQGQVLAGRVIDLVAGEFLAEDDFLTARAGAAGTEALAGPVAVGAPLLAEVATLALTAGVDGAVAA